MSRFTLVSAVAMAVCAASSADTIYVDASAGHDEWSGLCETWDGGTCGKPLARSAASGRRLPGIGRILQRRSPGSGRPRMTSFLPFCGP
jgi:hypothetical protein